MVDEYAFARRMHMAHSGTPAHAGGKLGTVHPGVPAGAESAPCKTGDVLAAKRDLELPRMPRKLDNFDLLVTYDLASLASPEVWCLGLREWTELRLDLTSCFYHVTNSLKPIAICGPPRERSDRSFRGHLSQLPKFHQPSIDPYKISDTLAL